MRKKTDKAEVSTYQFEESYGKLKKEQYLLKLYITGMTPRSVRAIENIKKICEQYLQGRYSLEVIDLYQNPTLAKGEQIIEAPTLIRKLPLPLRRIIGDMSNEGQLLVGLDLRKLINEDESVHLK
jgi:circadian clock protein KaiB